MAEQRLIDADSLLREVGNYSLQVACNKSDGRLEIMTKITQAVQDHAAKCIVDAPTIDPEALPIVRQLREELGRVTAERDAAVKDRTELADFELCVCEQFCFGDRERNIPPCEWRVSGKCKLQEWRGWQKEAHP